MKTQLILSAVVVFIILASGCIQYQNGENSRMRDIVSVGLSIQGTPSLGNEVELTVTYNSGITLDNVYFDIHIPEEFEVVSGETQWTGKLEGSYETRIKIKPKITGTFQIASLACVNKTRTETGITCNGGGAGGIFIVVTENDGKVSIVPFDEIKLPETPSIWNKL